MAQIQQPPLKTPVVNDLEQATREWDFWFRLVYLKLKELDQRLTDAGY